MKKLFYLVVALLPVLVLGQSTNQNYVKTKVYKTATTSSIATPSETQATQSITYFDGLGRPIQQVAHKQAGNGNDLVTHIEYDAFGRQTKEYLPVVNGQTLNYHSLDANSILSYYASPPSTVEATTNPYSEKLFEASPLNRVLEQAAPGNDWAMNSSEKHTIRFSYLANTTTDQVKLFKATATWSASSGLYDIALVNGSGTVFYDVNQLYKTVTKDENWVIGNNHTTEEFKDKEGRVVLKRTYGTSVINNVVTATLHDTYYVYDQYGNLTYVIPPLADGAITSTELNGLCYQYKYDHRNRLVEKKLPGKQWEFIVYDKLDRVVMTGPALSPFTSPTGNGWMITKYDVFSRPILTAWMSGTVTSATRKTNQDSRNTATVLNESKTTSNTTINGVGFRYTTTSLPTSGYHVLTVNYYDDYDTGLTFTPAISYSDIHGQALLNNTAGNKPVGLPTVSWVRVPETATLYKHEKSYTLYDKKGRVVRTFKNNYVTGYTQTDQKLQPITGRVDFTETRHKRLTANPELYVKDVFTYTNQDRLLSHTHQIGTAGTPQLLAKNEYDELGQLISKQVGGTDTTTFIGLQKVDYSYNIRGWLKGINNIDALAQSGNPTDLFAFKLNYNTIENENVYVGTKLYNGNISETYWRTSSDDVKRKYSYQYDELNRLKNAIYQRPENSSPLRNSYNESLIYDKNGNVKRLWRNGDLDANDFAIEIDDLTYTYHPANPNQLMKVLDSSNHPQGFKDDSNGLTDAEDDYGYDDFGNLKKDQNKQISSITYNHLNLPTSIVFADGKSISYLYNAVGQKVRKRVNGQFNTLETVNTDYMDGFQYTNGDLSFFPHAEGYVNLFKRKNGTVDFNYIFQYRDHLGNNRMSFTKKFILDVDDPFPAEILEENHYYPFGMKHTSYNTSLYDFVEVENGNDYYVNIAPVSGDYLVNKYKYNGKEYQDELGLNFYDYGARNYDPALGRFMNMDRFSEKYVDVSPYHYTKNNPVFYIDMRGDSLAVFRPNGSFWKVMDDGKKEWSGRYYQDSKVKSRKGKTVTYEYSNAINFEFADPENDSKAIKDGIITHIMIVTEDKIANMLGEAGAFDSKNKNNLTYMNDESVGGGKLDFSVKAIPNNFKGATANEFGRFSPYLYLPYGDKLAHNHYNFGNFLWGAAGSVMGYTAGTLQAAANANSLINSDTNGYAPQSDSADDQRSIKSGVEYTIKHQFIGKTWSSSSGVSPTTNNKR